MPRLVVACALACALVSAATASGSTGHRLSARALILRGPAPRCGPRRVGALDYGWPVRPFVVQQPIRGGFGDPRTVSTSPFGRDSIRAAGDYSFHNGVDIRSKVGRPVFPVVSGRAHVVDTGEVRVRSSHDRIFQYVHIDPTVRDGQHVIAYRTIIGRVRSPFRHVHLAEIDHGIVVNPLDHMRPYEDHAAPVVHDVTFWSPAGRMLSPRRLQGGVEIDARADDAPAIPVPGAWRGFPVAPAYVAARLVDAAGATVWQRVAADFRRTEPPKQDFWRVYAAGTYQNFPVFGDHYYWRVPGRYIFRLTDRPLDTDRLRNGSYTLHVVAADICGNRGLRTVRVRVANG